MPVFLWRKEDVDMVIKRLAEKQENVKGLRLSEYGGIEMYSKEQLQGMLGKFGRNGLPARKLALQAIAEMEAKEVAEHRAEVAEKALEFAIGNCVEQEPIVTELSDDDGEGWNNFCEKCNGEPDPTAYWMEFYKKKAEQALKKAQE